MGRAVRAQIVDGHWCRSIVHTWSSPSLRNSSILKIAVYITVVVAFATEALADKPGCELPPKHVPPTVVDQYYDNLIKRYGGADFANPPNVHPISQNSEYTLEVQYADNFVSGCAAHLRSYNGKLVGDTIRIHPGEQLFIRLDNELPSTTNPHPQDPLPPMCRQPFSFNMTNLHTHGVHTSPSGQ
jgi:hypothetical protein